MSVDFVNRPWHDTLQSLMSEITPQLPGTGALDTMIPVLTSQNAEFVHDLPVLAWSQDSGGTIGFLNRRWREYTGNAAPELAPEDFWPIVLHPEDFEAAYRGLSGSKGGTPAEMECRIRRFDGEYRWHLVKLANGCGVAIDIHARKVAEEELRDSAQILRTALSDLPVAIMVHAEDGEILAANKEFTRISGYELCDIPTVNEWSQRAYGVRAERVREFLDHLYSLKEPLRGGERAVQVASGATRLWQFSAAALGRLPDGRRLAMSVARDISPASEPEVELVTLFQEIAGKLGIPLQFESEGAVVGAWERGRIEQAFAQLFASADPGVPIRVRKRGQSAVDIVLRGLADPAAVEIVAALGGSVTLASGTLTVLLPL